MKQEKKHPSGTHPITATFGGRVRFERQVKGWKQVELASAAGLPFQTIARIESGEEEPSREIAERLAEALGISLVQLSHAPPFDAEKMTTPGVG